MSSHIHLKQNDTEPLDVVLARGGNAFVLDASDDVLFLMRLRDANQPTIEGECSILDAVRGRVRYQFLEGDLAVPGVYDAEWQVTFADGTIGTWPKDGYKTIIVQADIGPYIS